MSSENIVIIGFGSAGYAAMVSAKKTSSSASITVIDPKEYDLMHPCAIPYSLEGIVREADLYQNINLSKMGVKKIRGSAVKIDNQKKTILYMSESGENLIEYDSVVIATGARPIIPKIENMDKFLHKNIFTLTSVDDLKMIKSVLEGARRAVVIGGGAIGLESAVALKKYIPSVSVFEMKDNILPGIFDPDIAAVVEEHIKKHGIDLIKGKAITGFSGNDRLESVFAGSDKFECDICLMAAGFFADTSLASESGIDFSSNGIVVDEMMRTSIESVFAAGDSVSNISVIDKKTIRGKIATSAYKHGNVAGINSAGGSAKYAGSAGTFVSTIGGIEISGTGYNSETAKANGFNPVSGKIVSHIKPEYFPGNSEIVIKVIVDKDSGRILGAQAAGKNGAAERINIVSCAIEFGISAYEIGRIELAYCPAVSEVNDPLLRAFDFALRRIR